MKLTKKDIYSKYNFLEKNSFMDLDETRKIQNQKLKELLIHCKKNVSYYSKYLRNIDLNSYDDNYDKILKTFPILNKEIIRQNFDDLLSADYTKRRTITNTTGGSTGSPLKFKKCMNSWLWGMAFKWFIFSIICKYPCKTLRLWGSERDVIKKPFNLKSWIVNWFYRRKTINSFSFTEADLEHMVHQLNSYKPKIILAYVQVIYELAKYIKKNNLHINKPKGIITSAGTLHLEMRKLIEEVFDTVVINRYGSREMGDMAFSCKKNEHLHLNILDFYFEIVNKENDQVKPGETGRLLVTSLNNYSMPFIRYEIGDIAVRTDNSPFCSEYPGLPTIKGIEGRKMDYFITKDKKIISSEFFIHFIGVILNRDLIRRFQIIQETYNQVSIKYVPEDSQNNELKNFKNEVNKLIRAQMGEDLQIDWLEVEDIPPLKSGKYPYVVSKIKKTNLEY